MPLVWQSLLAN